MNWCLHSGHINIKQKKLFESAIDGRRLDKECNQHSVIEPRRCGRLRELHFANKFQCFVIPSFKREENFIDEN